MLESNPPRNSRLQTHREDGRGGETTRLRLPLAARAHRIDRFAHASENSNDESVATAARRSNWSLSPRVLTWRDGVLASCRKHPDGIY